MRLHKYTEEQLRDAVASSESYRQILMKLNVVPAGGNYQVLKRAIAFFEIDASHLLGQASNRHRKFGPKRPIEDYLSNRASIQSHKLRLRLIREGVFEARCSSCKLTEWLGEPIPLELDHINGIHNDNSLSNLRLLCPNCHAKTPTYRGKNKKK